MSINKHIKVILVSGFVCSVLPILLPVTSSALGPPSWWSGDCNVNNHSGAYSLTTHNGVKACTGGNNLQLVNFYSGAWGEYEWQCVELSMRYMYLAYGVAPYQANGKDVVWSYSGTRLTKVSNNGTSLPTPGDILSHDYGNPFGHTSVVSAVSVNSSGTGTVTIMEQMLQPPVVAQSQFRA